MEAVAGCGVGDLAHQGIGEVQCRLPQYRAAPQLLKKTCGLHPQRRAASLHQCPDGRGANAECQT